MNETTASEPPGTGRRRALRGLRVVAVVVTLSLVFSLVFSPRPLPSVVHSLCITLACWALIDGGRHVVARWIHPGRPGAAWPGWGWMGTVIVLGSAAGVLIGTTVARWLTGGTLAPVHDDSLRQTLGWIVFAMVPGFLATAFFYNRERLAASEARAAAAQRAASEHQLRLLQSQLEPHMLFNTLANLRVLIGLDPPRAQAMLDRLIAFLRATLAASRTGRHQLAAEFTTLADYLALMQVRMGERLQTRLDLPDTLAAQPVPPLLLQPLVENAIKHGLEPKVEGGRIDIAARRDGGQLVLTVRDTGVGLDAAQASAGTRFGLEQVRERLRTLYGDAARCTLAAATGDAEGGTLATITLPITDP